MSVADSYNSLFFYNPEIKSTLRGFHIPYTGFLICFLFETIPISLEK